MEHTLPHFWRMVLENKVGLIVMLTKLRERKANVNSGGRMMFLAPEIKL